MFKPKTALLLALVAIPAAASAQSAEQKGLEIAKAAKAYDRGFTDFSANMIMTLKNRSGETSTRLIRIRSLEVEGDGDRSLSIFDEPADVKGTKMLTYSHGLEPDDQWLYLPALKRVKRISSRNKSGPFMGSTFAFEDLGSQEVEKYTYRYLREEPCGDWTCHVIERYPAYEFSGYTRQVAWIDSEAYRLVKAEFYDRKKTLLKTLTAGDFRQYLGHYWRPGTMNMVNHQTGKSTLLEWNDYQFRTGLTESDFRSQTLKRND
ncbi:MAG: outer membrane lipoprotein-sorting protein [Gammaproteobacteria bacterium]|nr:outer membrane lipoprotein-sorting protein [Gammaproteobacteria bacterium]MDH3536366.1 outer membrane lipoprotein-sorting protein [Gammaproteobacteria bacterium]